MTDQIPLPPPDYTEDVQGFLHDTEHRYYSEQTMLAYAERLHAFKWCEDEIPVSQILALTPERPLFGHRRGKRQKTHWVTFMKHNAGGNAA